MSSLSRELIFPRPRPVSAWFIVLVGGPVVAALFVLPPLVERIQSRFTTSKEDVVRSHVDKLAFEAYPRWLVDHPDRPCPPSIEALHQRIDWIYPNDAWDQPYLLLCRDVGIVVVSAGEDGKLGTCDDIRSDERVRECR